MIRRVAAVLAVLLLGACQHDSKPPRTTVPLNSRFLFPSFLPTGFKVQRGQVTTSGPPRKVFGVALGQPAGEGTFTRVVLVTATEATADREVAADEKTTPVDIGTVRARQHDDVTTGAYVDWFAAGMAVSVSGPSGTGAVLVDAARRLQGARIDDLALPTQPAGYSTIASGHFVANAPDAGCVLLIGGPANAVITMTVAESTVPLVFAAAGGDRVESMTVRGHPGLVSTHMRVIQGRRLTERTMAWTERPGLTVSLTATTTTAQLVPVADGLIRLSEADWRRLVPS